MGPVSPDASAGPRREIVTHEAVARHVAPGAEDEREQPSLGAFARQREQYRRVLVREIRAVEVRIDDLEHEVDEVTDDVKPARRCELDDARVWRRKLTRDLELLSGVTHARWSSVRRLIGRHLGDERPASFPPWFERSYGI